MPTLVVKCRQCGRSAPANEFILDHIYRKMVCPMCIKDRHEKEKVHEEFRLERETKSQKSELLKPESQAINLKKDFKLMQRPLQQEKPIEDKQNQKRRFKCTKCTFEFPYNPATKTPLRCPYCNYTITYP
ncbi:MAG: hypothetical protein PHG05_03290 [Candidatus Nanoarchaeia archaeon]|nr:hypothetical protein [Candidatus Nanoarchaeia archaeon]